MFEIISAVLFATIVVSEIVSFWDEIIVGIKRIIEEIKNIVRGLLVGVKAIVEKVGGVLRRVTKSYSYEENEDQWYLDQRSVNIKSTEIPREIKAQLDYSNSVDITEPLKLEMENR